MEEIETIVILSLWYRPLMCAFGMNHPNKKSTIARLPYGYFAQEFFVSKWQNIRTTSEYLWTFTWTAVQTVAYFKKLFEHPTVFFFKMKISKYIKVIDVNLLALQLAIEYITKKEYVVQLRFLHVYCVRIVRDDEKLSSANL